MLLCAAVLAQAQENRPLIVYFAVADNSEVDVASSASVVEYDGAAMGKISALAKMIADKTDADVISLDVDSVYPQDIMAVLDYAQDEQDRDHRPVILNPIENFEQYDTVFVGYPLWWYDLPMVTYSLFDDYDFSGKTIIPFCTHNGSRFSGTIGTIEDLEPDAIVIREGFTVSEWDILEAADDVNAWLEGLGW
ncbi:MAG: flavodoxin [Clostridia bacterium]|nr:flavodoxin [Clostridia bacterium]